MKGIVIDINNKDAIILADDGLFTKVKNINYEIGQAIKIKENRKTGAKLIAGAAGMVAALAVCTIGAFAYYTPTDYVSLDVNPSVEYSINMFDRILDVKAVNDDGEEILSSLDLNNMTIGAAVKETLDKLMDDGYLTDDPNGGVVITTSNDELGEAEQLAAELEQEIQAYLDSREGVVAEVDAEAVGLERVQEARELGVTPGKLNLVEKLQTSTSGAINKEEWLNMPVKDINKAIKENRKQEKEKAREAFEEEDQMDRDDAATKGGVDWNDDDSLKEVRQNRPGNRKDDQNDNRADEQWNNENNSKDSKNKGIDQLEEENDTDAHDRLLDEDWYDDENRQTNTKKDKTN